MHQQEAKASNAIRQGDGTIVLSGFVKKLRQTWKRVYDNAEKIVGQVVQK